jgi:hypothetical protein
LENIFIHRFCSNHAILPMLMAVRFQTTVYRREIAPFLPAYRRFIPAQASLSWKCERIEARYRVFVDRPLAVEGFEVS